MFIRTLFSDPVNFLMVCLILVFSVCLHEFFHAWMAYREGDQEAAEYMTLNPFRQMGFMSLLMLAIIGIAWGAVPVHPERLRSRRSMLKVSLAGPAANLMLFLIAAVISLLIGFAASAGKVKVSSSAAYPVIYFVYCFGMYNFALMLFNLIPAPGLDGWNVVSELFPGLRQISSEAVKGAMLFLILLAFFGVPYLFMAGSFVMKLTIYLGSLLGGAS